MKKGAVLPESMVLAERAKNCTLQGGPGMIYSIPRGFAHFVRDLMDMLLQVLHSVPELETGKTPGQANNLPG